MTHPYGYPPFVPPTHHDMRTMQSMMAAGSSMAPISSSPAVDDMLPPTTPQDNISGLDLLRAASLQVPNKPLPPKSADSTAKSAAVESVASSNVESVPITKHNRIFIDRVQESDILCGRGGKSNHHAGNKRYRQVVCEMKTDYRSTSAKKAKTGLSRAIVDHVCDYGGRFIKKDTPNGRYYLLSKADARKKTSQALRETKILKWTM